MISYYRNTFVLIFFLSVFSIYTNVVLAGNDGEPSSTQATSEVKGGEADKVDQTPAEDNRINVVIEETEASSNLVKNPDFEKASKEYTTFPDKWKKEVVHDEGYVRLDTRVSKRGEQAVQVCTKSTSSEFGYIGLSQEISIDPNETYTLSGYIKTNLLSNGSAFFNTQQLDVHKKPVPGGWIDNREEQLTGTQDWVKRNLVFQSDPTACFVRVYLEVDHTHLLTEGSAWFDNIQLKRGNGKKIVRVPNGIGVAKNLLSKLPFLKRQAKDTQRFPLIGKKKS